MTNRLPNHRATLPAHDKYGCSTAARWIACPGSIAMCEGMPDTPSAYANEGTVAHEICAAVLQGQAMPEWVELCNRCAWRMSGGTCPKCGCREYRLDHDMPVYCQQFVDYITAICDANYVLHRGIEVRMQSERWPEHGAPWTSI